MEFITHKKSNIQRYYKAICLTVVLFLTFLVMAPNINNGWVNWDDHAYVRDNSLVKELSAHQIGKMFATF